MYASNQVSQSLLDKGICRTLENEVDRKPHLLNIRALTGIYDFLASLIKTPGREGGKEGIRKWRKEGKKEYGKEERKLKKRRAGKNTQQKGHYYTILLRVFVYDNNN